MATFTTRMLNGRPGNIEPQVQAVIAVAVTRFGLVVTSTSTGGHTRTSFHFPWNNPRRNGKGRAVDLAGTWKAMCAFFFWTRALRGAFDESFGPPNNQFIKHAQLYGGSIPNHYNHNHAAPKYGINFGQHKPFPYPTLRKGTTKRKYIRLVQRILKHLGYDVEFNGRYDRKTRTKVKRFQRAKGLRADGVIGPRTWRRLLRHRPK